MTSSLLQVVVYFAPQISEMGNGLHSMVRLNPLQENILNHIFLTFETFVREGGIGKSNAQSIKPSWEIVNSGVPAVYLVLASVFSSEQLVWGGS